ncbi:MAG: DnaJ domain-containing protein [Candidatus Obscuribacterales bacterium]|nr:DnaJ domain-containing protein [Candidatus Obscuribacterales bacterium]
MLDFQEDLYAVLGVEETAAPEEIRKAYLKLAKKLHPDRFPNDPEKKAEAQTEFSRVTRAHDVLSDAKQRDEYDTLRNLAKNKLAIDSGTAAAAPAAAAEKAPEQKGESREAWAVKHCERAVDMLKRKRFPEAETAIKEAIRLCPNNAVYHATLAEIQLGRGWKTLAMTAVQTALKIDPKNHEAKAVELKIKANTKSTGDHKKPAGEKAGFLDQLKQLLNKKS